MSTVTASILSRHLCLVILVLSFVVAFISWLLVVVYNPGDPPALSKETLVLQAPKLDAAGLTATIVSEAAEARAEQSPTSVFLQLTDLHTMTHGEARADFRSFVREDLPWMRPSAVFVTGDITDAQPGNTAGLHGRQVEEEWQFYETVLNEAAVENVTLWSDMRGEHDSFFVFGKGLNHETNQFFFYGREGSNFGSDADGFLVRRVGSHRVVTIDMAQTPGLSFPFNLFGTMPGHKLDWLDSVLTQLGAPTPLNQTFVMAHFPNAHIPRQYSSDGLSFPEIMEKHGVTAYMCGHAHLSGMYGRAGGDDDSERTLELELASWVEDRAVRVAVVDRGRFAFADARWDEYPIIVPTTPKDARFLVSSENVVGMAASAELRTLVLTKGNVTTAEAFIDGVKVCNLELDEAAGAPMYACPWQPLPDLLYRRGVHTLRISVADNLNNEREIEVPFAIDGSRVAFQSTFGRFVQRIPVFGFSAFLFGLALVGGWLLLVPKPIVFFLRRKGRYRQFWLSVMQLLDEEDRRFDPTHVHHMDNTTLAGYLTWQARVALWQYGEMPALLWALLFLAYANLTFGVWLFGDFVDGYWGFLTPWGLLTRQERHEVMERFLGAAILIMGMYVPLTVLASKLSFRGHRHFHDTGKDEWVKCRHGFAAPSTYALAGLAVFTFALSTTVIIASINITAFILSPAVLWAAGLAVFAVFYAATHVASTDAASLEPVEAGVETGDGALLAGEKDNLENGNEKKEAGDDEAGDESGGMTPVAPMPALEKRAS